MDINMERLLRLVADYHNFSSDYNAEGHVKDSEELSIEDLDLISAAMSLPANKEDGTMENKKTIY